MATKRNRTTAKPVRDLPAETQLELKRQKALKMMEDVKAAEAKARAAEHQRNIEKLKE